VGVERELAGAAQERRLRERVVAAAGEEDLGRGPVADVKELAELLGGLLGKPVGLERGYHRSVRGRHVNGQRQHQSRKYNAASLSPPRWDDNRMTFRIESLLS
jgi:hypothetical protein